MAAMPRLDGDFPGGCCVFLGERDGKLVCRPDTPERVTGGQWFRFLARLTDARTRQTIELHWPPDDEEVRARSEYGGTKNFVTAIDRTLHVSADGRTWQPVPSVAVEGQAVRFDVEADAAYVSVGIPYLPDDLDRLFSALAAHPEAHVQEIARTARGRPVRVIRIGPEDGGAGSFYLQAQQHPSEWAGSRILSALARHLLSDAGAALRSRFVFHLVPVMDVDGIYSRREAVPTNMNRDWAAFRLAETTGARDYLRRLSSRGERWLHALDLHMGWVDRANSGACLTVYPDGSAPEEVLQKQFRIAECVFARTDWTDRVWRRSRDGTFTAWMYREFGVPAQTAEFSRHLVREREGDRWVRVTQDHEEALGPALADALAACWQ